MRAVLLTIALAVASATALPGQSKAAAPPTATELDQLLAPIALYPDSLLAQMLMCATKPASLGALAEWLRSQSVEGSALQDAASAAGFEPSFVALAIFPDVVNSMLTQMERTTRIGQAFVADRSSVFASIQRLRAKAKAAGTLKTTTQQQVETKTTSSGEQVIVIEPSNPQVVYVPQYNPQVVYTQPTTSTVVIKEESSSSDAVAAGLIGFTAGIAIGAAIDNDYYYGPYGWHGGGYMYNDAWDDYYDHREDAREDWQDHREDMGEERGDRAKNTQEQRTERSQNRQETAQNRDGTRTNAQTQRTGTQAATSTATQSSAQAAAAKRGGGQEARGYSGEGATTSQRTGTKSDAFSGYSSGKSERAASQRGQRSRSSSSRSGGGSRRR
jgi:Protein of unknown function (DUF3300)